MVTLYIITVGILIGMVGYLTSLNAMTDTTILLTQEALEHTEKALGLHYAIASTQSKTAILKDENLIDKY